MQKVLNGVAHAGEIVTVAGVRLVVDEEDGVGLDVVPPRHSEHHNLTWTRLQNITKHNLTPTLLKILKCPYLKERNLIFTQ